MRPKLLVLTATFSLALAGTATAQAERVTSSSSLEVKARWVANHGGITGTCAGCATPQMQTLSRLLVIQRFSSAGSNAVRWALCVVGRESGFNPGAVNSSSGAASLFQLFGHPQFSTWRMLHDPGYAVMAGWNLSHGAKDRSPWYGGNYNC